MDPDENLDEQREVADILRSKIDAGSDDENIGFGSEEDLERTDQLVELVKALDTWVMNGGFLPKEWTLRCNGGFMKRAALAERVYQEAIDATETFEGDFGMQLAYLFGAILKNSNINLDTNVAEEAEVLEFFRTIFNDQHPVWAHISIKASTARTS